jgi:hypothetical protein
MNRRWVWRKTCSCPAVWECPDCHTQLPATQIIGQPKRCRCDDLHEEMQRMQAEAGKRYWEEIGPCVETWDLREPD